MAAKAPKTNYLRVSALMLSLQLLFHVFYSIFVVDRSGLRDTAVFGHTVILVALFCTYSKASISPFYPHDIVSGVFAMAMCPSICLSVRLSQPVLYQND